MFRKLRILILLLILATVALGAWRTNSRLTAWEHTVHVAIYPIAADDSPATSRFIGELAGDDFADIARWLQEQSDHYGRSVLQPVALRLAPPLATMPPLPPGRPSTLDAILWSLHLRWWASRHDRIDGPQPQVRLIVLFHDPERMSALPHSTGLSKGQIGVIHAFASRPQRRQNAVVIAHELLHTFGANDKYDLATLQPIYPAGYAEPERSPRLPQDKAEIMGGRTPVDEQHADMLAKGEKMPVDFTNRVIYYVGPVDPVRDKVVGPAGPAAATRMDKFTRMMLEKTGLISMIGKSERGPVAIEAIKSAKVVGFADLGMEAIYEFDVENMPVTVAVDSSGTSVHNTGPKEWQVKIGKIPVSD